MKKLGCHLLVVALLSASMVCDRGACWMHGSTTDHAHPHPMGDSLHDDGTRAHSVANSNDHHAPNSTPDQAQINPHDLHCQTSLKTDCAGIDTNLAQRAFDVSNESSLDPVKWLAIDMASAEWLAIIKNKDPPTLFHVYSPNQHALYLTTQRLRI